MAGFKDRRDDSADGAVVKLNEGLNSCRKLLANYRAMLSKRPSADKHQK